MTALRRQITGGGELVLEEDEPVAAAAEAEVKVKERRVEEEGVPAAAHGAEAEEGGRREKGEDSIEKFFGKISPYSAVHFCRERGRTWRVFIRDFVALFNALFSL